MESTHKGEHRRKRKKKKIWVADQVDKEAGPTVIQMIIAIVVFMAVIALAVKLLIIDQVGERNRQPGSTTRPK